MTLELWALAHNNIEVILFSKMGCIEKGAS